MPLGRCHFDSAGDDELVDDDLRAVGEIAELRLPEAEHVRVIERVTVIETEHGRFGEQAVVNAEARLLCREMEQRHVRLAGLRVIDERRGGAERAAPAVLAGESHRRAFEQQ